MLGFGKDVETLRRLAECLGAEVVIYERGVWGRLLDYDCIVAYMPAAIVIRGLCPHLRSKWEDPAVVVVDKPLRHAIPILGAHHGGNEVARRLQESLGVTPVITTALDFSEGLSVGVGFRRGVRKDEIIEAVRAALQELGAELKDIRVLATVEDKRRSAAIIEVADELKRPLIFVSREEINRMDVRATKAEIIGVKSVAEACAIYASRHRRLVFPKRVYGGVTVAVAR